MWGIETESFLLWALSQHCQYLENIVTNEGSECGLGYYPSLRLQRLTKTRKKFNQDIQCPSWDMNWPYREYMSKALSLGQCLQLKLRTKREKTLEEQWMDVLLFSIWLCICTSTLHQFSVHSIVSLTFYAFFTGEKFRRVLNLKNVHLFNFFP